MMMMMMMKVLERFLLDLYDITAPLSSLHLLPSDI